MEWDVLYDETFVTELVEVERQSGSSAVREEREHGDAGD